MKKVSSLKAKSIIYFFGKGVYVFQKTCTPFKKSLFYKIKSIYSLILSL